MPSGVFQRFSTFALRYTPDPWIVVLLLTALALGLAAFLTPAPFPELLRFWVKGFSTLHTFAMQMTLVLLTGEILARAPVMEGVLERIVPLGRYPGAVFPLLALFSMGTAYLHWGFSLILCGIVVRKLHRAYPGLPLPLLIATAYLGLGTTWHCGFSGSVPLLLATPGHFLVSETGVVPVRMTLFHPFNLLCLALLFLTLPWVSLFLYRRFSPGSSSGGGFPRGEELREVEPEAHPPLPPEGASNPQGAAPSPFLRSPWVNRVLGACGLTATALLFYREGGSAFHLDTLNLLFLFLGVLLHPHPASLLRAVQEGVGSASGVIFQFPFYGGIFGILKESGAAQEIARFFLSLSTPKGFPLLVFLYTALMNYLVPSGGSKWVIEAPYLIQVLKGMNLPLPFLVLPYIWGDMATNLIQPFWALPLLKMLGGEFREVIVYTTIYFLFLIVLLFPAFLILGRFAAS